MKRSRKGISSVFAIILFAVFFVIILSFSSYYIQTSVSVFNGQIGFTRVSEDVRNEFCYEELGVNYTQNPLSPNEPYCTASLNLSSREFVYDNNIAGLNFTGWFQAYSEENKYIEDDSVNGFVDKFLFGIIIISMLFSIFTVFQKDTITNVKMIFFGIFGVPIILFIFVILSRVIDYILEMLIQVFPNISMVNIFAPFPLVDHFFSYLFWYIIPFVVIWVIGAVTNKEILEFAFKNRGGDDDS